MRFQMRLLGAAAFCLTAALSACNGASDRYTGYVEGEYVRIGSPIAGRLDRLQVRQGDTVAAGTPLFALESAREQAMVDEAQQRLAQARAQLSDLQKGKRPEEIDAIKAQLAQAVASSGLAADELKRTEALFGEGVATSQKLDQARSDVSTTQAHVSELRAQLRVAALPGRKDQLQAADAETRAAQATLAQAQWQLDQKTVKAPAAGVIDDVYYRNGEWVPATAPIVSLLPPENRKVRFYLPETVAGGVHAGSAVRVSCDGCGAPINATVRYVSAQAEYTPPVIYSRDSRSKLVFLAEAWPSVEDAKRLRVGQPADVSLMAGAPGAP